MNDMTFLPNPSLFCKGHHSPREIHFIPKGPVPKGLPFDLSTLRLVAFNNTTPAVLFINDVQ